MSNSTNRTPFTVPLTSTERRFIQEQIDLVMRQQGRHIRTRMSRGLDFEQEVDDALAEFHRRGPWPPECEVPTAALSALVGA